MSASVFFVYHAQEIAGAFGSLLEAGRYVDRQHEKLRAEAARAGENYDDSPELFTIVELTTAELERDDREDERRWVSLVGV